MTGETEIPDTGAVFTFGKSKIANNAPSRLWLKSDIPVHISCGQSHSAFVTEQGRLFVFGDNNRGQLGLQTKGPVTKPVCVKVLKGERVQSVACGTDHTLVSTSQGEILAAGGNSDGQLGLGHCKDSFSFQRLRPFCDYTPIRLLSAGDHTSAALTEDGRLFLWGDNSAGQLGFGNDSHALLPKELKLGQSVHWVSCGYRHSGLVTDSGDVYTFGESADGRLGLSAHQLANHSHPQRVESLHSVLRVACGGKHTLALTEDELYCFGGGEFGQLGLGTLVFVADSPVAVGHFRKGRVTHVTCGEQHSALITDSGLLYTFGDGHHGKLGHGDENFTNQFSPTVCQRFFEYSVMTVACGSSHMLVFARPRQQESEEVCLEDEDVTYSYLDRCYTSMLQGQPLEHIPDPESALSSQSNFLSSPLPTSHRWSLSTRARRRQRESSSAQFGPEFSNLPPLTTSYTALALSGTILQPRSSKSTPKHINTDAPVDISITVHAKEPSFTPITKSPEDCQCVETSENSLSNKTSAGREENVSQQVLPTELQDPSVSHPSITESQSSSNLMLKKPRSGDVENTAEVEEHSSVTALRSKVQPKTNKKTIQSTNNKYKDQVEVKSSPDGISAKENEGLDETCSTNFDLKDAVSKADTYSKDCRGEEVITLSDTEQETKSSSIKIQQASSSVQEVEKVRTTPTSTQEVQSPKTKEAGISAKASKRVKSPIKVREMPTGEMEVSKVKPTPQIGAQSDVEPSIEKVGLTLIDTQEQGNLTPHKIIAEMQSTPEKGNGRIIVDTPSDHTAKKAKKKRTAVERGPIAEPSPKTPSPPSVSIPARMSKVKKENAVEPENSSLQLRSVMQAQEATEKGEKESITPQSSENISFPPIKSKKSAAEKSQSASTLQSDHKNSQSPTDKALAEQKHEFPSIKSLAPERSRSVSNLWSNNQSATNKSSTAKATESGKLFSSTSSSPQLRHSPLNKRKLKTVEPKEPVLVTETPHQQSEQTLMGSVVSVLPAMAIASAAPLLIKAAEVLSETSLVQSNEMSSCASASQETAGNKILPEQEVEQDSTVQDISTIEETDDNRNKQQIIEDLQNELVSDEVWRDDNGKMDDDEDEKGGETEGEEKESVAEEEDKSDGCGKEEEDDAFVDEPEVERENAQKGGEDSEEEEGEEEEKDAVGQEKGDDYGGKSSEIEGEKSEGGGSGDMAESEEGEESGGQEEEEGETEDKDAEDEEEERESGDEDSEGQIEDEEKSDAEEGESSNEEETEGSESEDVSKNDRSDEEEGESEVNGSEREEEEDVEEGEQEESGVGNEDEEENQEEEEENQTKEEEEEENNEELTEEDKSEDEEGEESLIEKEEQEVEDEDEEKMSDEGSERQEGGEQIEEEDEEGEKEGKMESSEVTFREEEKTQHSTETQQTDDEENKEDKSENEEEEDDDDTDKQEERRGGSDRETEEEEEDEEAEQKETSEEEEQAEGSEEEEEESERNSGKTRESSEEEEELEENEEDEEEEEAEWKEKKRRESSEEEEEEGEEEEEEEEAEQKENVKKDKHSSKLRENEDEEEEEEEEGEEEEEEEGEEEEDEPKNENKNIKTGKDGRKHRTITEDDEEEEGNEEEEEETKQEKKNIITEKNRRKQTETSAEEEEEEEEGEEEEEDEEESEEEEGEEEDESEEEKEKTKKITKQKGKPNVLPARRQTNGQTETQKTRQRGKQNVKMRKQTDGAQDPQFWNNVLPQYLNLK
ncbi:X-linked retinitis pigmentosa GTPase regulator [Danio aesculapii]|uniref:X-linked retinitis pigmentosa GTPase regulator n=1 Tax=Danio aesculapii TaxID=1142201 RepID=UPI0024C0E61D|nr:X-linked retinitis pigmentosa GTPase regulator [Danio aesculapii]